MSKIVIVCDVPDHYIGDKIFTQSVQKNSFGERFWVIVKAFADGKGWEMVTADIFLNQCEEKLKAYKSYFISYISTARTAIRLKSNATLLMVYSLESPNVALNFYTNIEAIVSKYKYSMLLKGIADSIPDQSRSLTLNWPNTLKAIKPYAHLDRRDLICMIASSKSKYDFAPNKRFNL